MTTSTLSPAATSSQHYDQRQYRLPVFDKGVRELRDGHRASVRGLGWSADGKRLASASADKSVRIWTPERSTDVRSSTDLQGHTDAVDQLAWDPTRPEHLTTASSDRSVKFWDIRTSKPTGSISTPTGNINLAYHPTGMQIAVGDRSDTIMLMDVRTLKMLGKIRDGKAGTREEINEVCWSHDGSTFLLTTGNGVLKVLDATVDLRPSDVCSSISGSGGKGPTGASSTENAGSSDIVKWPTVLEIMAHTASIFCAEFDPMGRYVATASADATVALWDTREWMNVSVNSRVQGSPRSISFSHDGEMIAVGGEERFIDITGTSRNETLHRIPVPAAINKVVWHPSRPLLAFAGEDRSPASSGTLSTGSSGGVGTIRVYGLTDRA